MKPTSAEKIKKNLSLPAGQWQLFTYGRLASLPTAKQAIWIKAAFRRVDLDRRREIAAWTDEVLWRDVPVGELVAWEVGSIFDANALKVGRAQPIAPQIGLREIEVDFAAKNCRLVRRYERDQNGDYKFKNPRLLPEHPDADVHFLRVERGDDTPLLIPCTTVLQSFWGRSSNLVHMLLDSRFLDFDRYVINMNRSSFDRSTGHACLWLRQWSLDSDAKFLATLAFDKQAIERGQNIAKTLQSALSTDSGIPPRCISALPPHDGPVTLTVWGYEIKTVAGPYFYVQRLIQNSYVPAFSKLTYDRDNDGRPSASTSENDDGNGPSQRKPIEREQLGRPRKEGSSEFELSQDHPCYQSTQETCDIGRFDTVFPCIADVPAEKLAQLELEFENIAEAEAARIKRWNKLSTLPGVRQSSAEVVGTTLAAGEVQNDPQDTSIKLAGPPLGQLLAQVIRYTSSPSVEMLPLGIKHVDITPVFPWSRSMAHGGHWLFSLPAEFCDYPWAWLYSDPAQTERKRGMCLRITYFDDVNNVTGVGYVVDVEGRFTKTRMKKVPAAIGAETQQIRTETESPKESKNDPVLYIWRQSEESTYGSDQNTLISSEDLRQLIIELVGESGTSAAEAAMKKGICCQPRRHRTAEVHLDKLLAELLEHIQKPR